MIKRPGVLRKTIAAASLLAALLLGTPAFSQTVQQSGTVTQNQLPVWITRGVIGPGGTSADSPISSIGATGNICSNSARQASGAWIALCLGYLSGVPTISVQNFGSASAQPLQFNINGTNFAFPGSLANITIGVTPVVGGTNSQCLFVSAGVVGQQACTLSAITALTGDGTATGPGSSIFALAPVNSNTGTFGSGAVVPIITVNAKGLITAVSTSPVSLTVGSSAIGSGATNSILYQNGTVLGELGVVGNAVLSTNGSGVPALSTTLPSGLTIPSPTVSGTATLPDSATWSNLGISKVAGLSVGSATLPAGGNVSISGQYQVNGTQIAASNLSNGTTGSGTIVLNTSPGLSGTVTGNITLSGNLTLSGNDTFTAQAIFQGISAPASAGGNTVVMGTIAAPTLSNTGQAFLYNTLTGGSILQGDGSTSDITVANKSAAAVFTVPTGTTKLNFPSLASGACSNGLGLDSGNNTILTSCPGAASSIQVGSTTVTSGTSGFALYNNAGVLGNASFTGPLQLSAGAISINATTTAHAVAVWEGTSAMAAIGPGTSGQALISGGGSADPSYVGGAMVLLNTLTASNSATLSDTTHITSTYNEYVLIFENIVPATTAVSCELQVHSNGSFPATSYSSTGLNYHGAVSAAQSQTTFIPCDSGTGALANSGTGLSGEITLYNASQTSSPKMWVGNVAENNALVGVVVSGTWTGGNTAIDGFQVLMSSGNITSGTIKLYGRL